MTDERAESTASTIGRTAVDPRVGLAMERTGLAEYRTSLAMDRTTLAWVRTTLTMTSFGLGMIGFFRSVRERAETPDTIRMHEAAIHFGAALVVIGVIVTALVVWGHLRDVRRLRAGMVPVPATWPLSVLLALLMALLAVGGLWGVFGR